jgi:hypothetical protein
MYLVTADGKQIPVTSRQGTIHSANHEEYKLHLAPDAFDPAATSLVIREPAAITVVPITFTFKDAPIVDRPLRNLATPPSNP